MCFSVDLLKEAIILLILQFAFYFQAFPSTLFTDPRYIYIMSHPLDHPMHILLSHHDLTLMRTIHDPVADAANDRSTDV